MDITIHQISNGTKNELLLLRDSLINYLKMRKFGSKIIHLLKLLKSINNQLELLKSSPSISKINCSKDYDKDSPKAEISLLVPVFITKKSQFLKTKRKLEEEIEIKKLAEEEEKIFKIHFTLEKNDLFNEEEDDNLSNYYSLRKSSTKSSSSDLCCSSCSTDDFESMSNSNIIDDMFIYSNVQS